MATQDDLREGRQPVDGAVWILDPADLVDGAVDRRAGFVGGVVVAAAGGDRIEPGAPGVGQVVDVRPLVLDLLAELLEDGIGIEGAVDRASRIVSSDTRQA